MKVLFVSNDPTILEAGSGTYLRMKEYANTCESLHIVTAGKHTKRIDDDTLHVHAVTCNRLTRVHALARAARTIILAESIQVVSAQDPFEHGLAALKATRGTNAKLHIQVHTDFLSPWFVRESNIRALKVPMPFVNRLRRRIAKQVLPQAHGIRCVSVRIKESLIKAYGATISVPTVIPIQVFTVVPEAVPLPTNPFTFTLITVGRLEAEKRIQDILTALWIIRDRYPSVGLLVVGKGSELPRLLALAHKLKLEGRVLFTNAWRTDAWGLMRSSQAYIQASAYEGYGRTLVEAALAEVPIITTDVGIVGEVFIGYEDVLAAPVADPMALAVHIGKLVEDLQARTLLTLHAKATVEKHLRDTDVSASSIVSDLERLL